MIDKVFGGNEYKKLAKMCLKSGENVMFVILIPYKVSKKGWQNKTCLQKIRWYFIFGSENVKTVFGLSQNHQHTDPFYSMEGDCKKRLFVCGRHHAKQPQTAKNLVSRACMRGNQKKLQSYERLRGKHWQTKKVTF